jgi:hypothetical protein
MPWSIPPLKGRIVSYAQDFVGTLSDVHVTAWQLRELEFPARRPGPSGGMVSRDELVDFLDIFAASSPRCGVTVSRESYCYTTVSIDKGSPIERYRPLFNQYCSNGAERQLNARNSW